MTCTTCGAIGTPGTSWCRQCYVPYARAAGSIPPPPNYVPGQAAPQYANAFAAPPAPSGYPGGFPRTATLEPPPTLRSSKGLVLPLHAFEVGDLPRVCVITGKPVSTMTRVRWHWSPPWTAAFVLFGILPALILGHMCGEGGQGFLPMQPGLYRRKSQVLWASTIGLMVGTVIAIIAAAGNSALGGLIGVAMIVASVTGIIKYSSQAQLRRVAPGYLALRNPHPNFVQAFKAGRPPGQAPYVSQVPPTRRSRGQIVALVVVVVVVLGSIGAGIRQAHVCGAGRLHPHRSDVSAALTTDRRSLELLSASRGIEWSPSDGQQVLAADAQLESTLGTIPLNAADRAAVDAYLGSVARFDDGLRAYMSSTAPQAEERFRSLGASRNAAYSQLASTLDAPPEGCPGP